MTRFLLLTTNRSGVLSRIISIVSSTGANIESVAAYPLADSELAIIHLMSESTSVSRERLVRKLSRLVDVIECSATDENANLQIDLAAHLSFAGTRRNIGTTQ